LVVVGQFDGDITAPARQAIERVRAARNARGRGEEIAGRSGEGETGTKQRESQGRPETGISDADRGPGEIKRSNETAEGTPTTKKPTDLTSTAPVGLTDEELETWAKNRGFRVEPAGEQLGIFGGADKVFRVFRTTSKGTESGLVYENQLDRLGLSTEPEAYEPPPEQTSLFRGESGSFEPGKLGEAAVAIKDFLKERYEPIQRSRELQSGMYDLESQYQGDVLRAVQTMEKIVGELGKQAPKDFETIYHHLENPDLPLTPEQDKVLDDTILPLMEESNRIYEKLTDGGIPAENYVHRVVKNKGGFFDRILAGSKGSGRGNVLQKSAPQTKHRTMMARLQELRRDGELLLSASGICAGSLRCDWIQPTDPMHGLTAAIDEGIYTEILAKRVPPAQPWWTRALLLPQQCKKGQQTFGLLNPVPVAPEVANGVSIAVWHVLGQPGNELLDRIPHFDQQLRLPVLRQELDFSRDLHEKRR
jgi:hypothetical protein